MCEAAAVLLRLSVRGGAEVVVTVTPPRVSHSPRSLLPLLAGVRHGVNLDVALAAGVRVPVRGVTDSSRGPQLLLLLCDSSAAFCGHSHAGVCWNEARRE